MEIEPAKFETKYFSHHPSSNLIYISFLAGLSTWIQQAWDTKYNSVGDHEKGLRSSKTDENCKKTLFTVKSSRAEVISESRDNSKTKSIQPDEWILPTRNIMKVTVTPRPCVAKVAQPEYLKSRISVSCASAAALFKLWLVQPSSVSLTKLKLTQRLCWICWQFSAFPYLAVGITTFEWQKGVERGSKKSEKQAVESAIHHWAGSGICRSTDRHRRPLTHIGWQTFSLVLLWALRPSKIVVNVIVWRRHGNL